MISINQKTTRKEWQAKSPMALVKCNYVVICSGWNRGGALSWCKDSNEDDKWDVGKERDD